MAFFGFGQASPFAEADQKAQDQQTAFQGMRDNLPALGLIAGLSMLARNNGNRSVGQLVGAAGGDALNAYGTWQKMQEAKKRLEMEDQWKKDEREYQRGQDAWRNNMAERKFGLDAAKMAQDLAMQRQRLGMEGARLALARQNAALAAGRGNWAVTDSGMLINKDTGEIRVPTDKDGNPLNLAASAFSPGAKKFAEELAKKNADAYTGLQSGATAAHDTMAKMDQLDKILGSGLYTGPGGDVVQSLRKTGVALGLGDAQAAANAETFERIGNELALAMRNPDSGFGMPGAMSDKDREFLVSMAPSLNKSTEGNRMSVEMTRRMAKRKIELAEMAGQYVRQHGMLDDGFYSQVRDYSAKNPMFAGLEGKYGASAKPKGSVQPPNDIVWK